jgi:hypothetical protein
MICKEWKVFKVKCFKSFLVQHHWASKKEKKSVPILKWVQDDQSFDQNKHVVEI